MASMPEAIRSVLVADETFSGLVSTRVRVGKLLQDETMPAVLITQLPDQRYWAMGATPDHNWVTLQFDCFDDTLAGCVAVADALDGALNGYSGTSESVVVQYVELETAAGPYWEDGIERYRLVTRGTVKYDG